MKIPKVKRPSKELLGKIQALNKKKGEVAVIDPDSGEYFLGKTLTEAIKRAKSKYPDNIFYSVRIGSSFVHEHKGGMRKL